MTDNMLDKGIGNELFEQKERIKLTKNSKGNFQWEVTLLSLDVEKLEEINKKLEEKFGR